MTKKTPNVLINNILKDDSISISTSNEENMAYTIRETEDRVKDLLNIKPVKKPKKNNESV